MKFTTEEIEKILEQAMNNCLRPESDENEIVKHMQNSFNNGVKLMMKESLIQFLTIENKGLLNKGVSA